MSTLIPTGFDNITVLRGSKYIGVWDWEETDFTGNTATIKIKNIHEQFKDVKNVYEVGVATVCPLDIDGNPYTNRIQIELSKEDTLKFAIPDEEEFSFDDESGYYSILNITLDDGTVVLTANVKVVNSIEAETLNFLLDEKDEAIIINQKLDNLDAYSLDFIAQRDTYLQTLSDAQTNIDMQVEDITTKHGEINQIKDDVIALKGQVETIFDNFDDRYLGAFATNPTLDNDGNALAVGAIYLNSTAKELRFYNGATWDSPVAAAQTYAQQASLSATNAANSATSASSSATSATSSKNAAATSATNAANSASTATTKANEASASATSASNSATSASQSLDSINGILATLPDGTINDTLIGVDKAFSNQSLVGAFGNLSSPLLDLPLHNSLTMKAGVGSATFTRASTATYIDRYGVLKTAGVDEPRFEKEGYLNEGSSTNLLTYSENFTNDWSLARTTVNKSTTTVAPDGNSTAYRIDTMEENNTHILYKYMPTLSSSYYSLSVFVKAAGTASGVLRAFGQGVGAIFDLNNKTITNGKLEELNNGWFRVTAYTSSEVTKVSWRLFIDVEGSYSDTSKSLFVWGAQLEALPFATSYIPTTDSAVTRSADVLQVTRENNFPNAENNKEGYSVAFAYDFLGIHTANQFLWSIYVDGNNYVEGYLTPTTGSLRNAIKKDVVRVTNLTIPVNLLGANKVVQIQSNTFLKQYVNGILVDTDVNTLGTLGGGVNSLTNITLGGLSGVISGNLFGHISNFKVYDRELTPVEVALL